MTYASSFSPILRAVAGAAFFLVTFLLLKAATPAPPSDLGGHSSESFSSDDNEEHVPHVVNPAATTSTKKRRPVLGVLDEWYGGGSNFCPVLSPHGLCGDTSQALEVTTMADLGSIELLFRTSNSTVEQRSSNGYLPLRCHNSKGGMFAENGIGYAGGTVSACPPERPPMHPVEASGVGDDVGDVDSFIVAVRATTDGVPAQSPSKDDGNGTRRRSSTHPTSFDPSFRDDIMEALRLSAKERTDPASVYHSVLHSDRHRGVQLYSLNRRRTTTRDNSAKNQRAKRTGLRSARGSQARIFRGTMEDSTVWSPVEVDAVVTFVDGLAPGFQKDLTYAHANYERRPLCASEPPTGVADDYNHTWRHQFKAKKADNIFGMGRWRNWGELRYCLRGIFRHGGMHRGGGPSTNRHFRYRRIFLVMNSLAHTPSWLRKREIANTGEFVFEEDEESSSLDFPLLTLVPHSAFIPKCILPTFSSQGIEPFLNRIPGISRWFVYINEDTLLSRRLSLLDYFQPLPPVRQDAKAHHLKMKYGADVFDSITAASDGTYYEVAFLEPSLYAEGYYGAHYVFKKDVAAVPDSGKPLPPTPKPAEKFPGIEDVIDGVLRRRARRYKKFAAMVKGRLDAVEEQATKKNRKAFDSDAAASLPPLRPSSLFDIACPLKEPPGIKLAKETIMRLIEEQRNETGLVLHPRDQFAVPFARLRGQFFTTEQTCYNSYMIHKKLDGVDPFLYFPHMSPLFDGYMLQRLVGAPSLDEEEEEPALQRKSQRGYFEEEFLGRTVFNELRRMTDAVVPMLYQPFAAAQRRFFTATQLAESRKSKDAADHRKRQSQKQMDALRKLHAEVADLSHAIENRVMPLLKNGSADWSSVEGRLDGLEQSISEQAVKSFGHGYADSSEDEYWDPQVVVPSSALSNRLSLRPVIAPDQYSFMYISDARDMESNLQSLKEQHVVPLFVTFNDAGVHFDRNTKLNHAGETFDQVQDEANRALAFVCGKDCTDSPAPPWEEQPRTNERTSAVPPQATEPRKPWKDSAGPRRKRLPGKR